MELLVRQLQVALEFYYDIFAHQILPVSRDFETGS